MSVAPVLQLVIISRKKKKSIDSGLVRAMSRFSSDKLTFHHISFERLSVHRDGAQSRMSFLRASGSSHTVTVPQGLKLLRNLR